MAEARTANPASEYRALRPYAGVGQVQEVLDCATLRIGTDLRLEADSSQILEANTYLTSTMELDFLTRFEGEEPDELPSVFFARLASALTAAGLDDEELSNVRIVVVATTPYLKLLDEIWQGSFHDLVAADGLLTLALAGSEGRPRPLLTPSGGCNIEAIVYLGADRAHDRSTRPLEVHAKGTWLARIKFDLDTDLAEIGFTPTPLSDEIRETYELTPHTVRFITAGRPLDPEGEPTDLNVYVDEEMLNTITANPGGSGARSFQIQLAIDVVGAIVCESSRLLAADPDLTLASIHGSLCHRLIRQASRTESGKVDEAQEEAMFTQIKDDPLRVVAVFEGSNDVIRKRLLANVKDSG